MSELLEQIVGVVKEAGVLLLDREKRVAVYAKEGVGNFVTDADFEIQKLLISRFTAILPEADFFGEEDTEGSRQELKSHGYTFLIDPIDGTTNYMMGYHHSCISVGLAKDGKMVLAAVLNPYTDDLYTAEKGKGAYLNGVRLEILPREVKDGIAAFGIARYNETDAGLFFSLVRRLYETAVGIREGGSAALDLCRVATGANASYVEFRLSPYDFAAASLLIEEAGGVIVQTDGSPITLDKPCGVIAGSEKAVNQVLSMISELKKGAK